MAALKVSVGSSIRSWSAKMHPSVSRSTCLYAPLSIFCSCAILAPVFVGDVKDLFWDPFLHSGICIKRCHRYFVFAGEPAPFPHQSNVEKVFWWLHGPAKKDAIRARGHLLTHLHQLCLGGEGRRRAEKLCRRMAPFYANTGMKKGTPNGPQFRLMHPMQSGKKEQTLFTG